MSLRSRSINYLSGVGFANLYDSAGNRIDHSPRPYSLSGFQTTSSHGHPVSLIGKTGADIGGSFATQATEIDSGARFMSVAKTQGGLTYEYVGPLFAWSNSQTSTSTGLLPASSDSQLVAFGVTGIARALPTNPLSGMGQFIGELRDLPKVPLLHSWRSKARDFKSLARHGANEYLNIQFGWVPFVNDLRSAIKVTHDYSKNVRNYARNSGQHVRRGSTVFMDSSTTTSLVSSSWNGVPALATPLVASPGKLYKTETTRTHIYFRGAFTYYLPSDDTSLGKLKRFEALANKLYGTRLNPDLLWKLAPWSWAADWIGNIGDNVHNFSAFASDDLVMHYGYLMEEKSITTTYAGTDLRLSNGDTVSLTQTFTNSCKSRIQATPFGFGLNPSSFSAKQWSIIAALGISRGPRALNIP